MNNDYDPGLQALFRQAQQEFDRDAFTRSILERIDRERRRAMLAWSAIGLAGVVVLALLANPLFTALTMATQLLPMSPINSIAAVIAIGALGIRRFFRRFLG